MIIAANKIEQIIFSTFKLMLQTAFFYIVDYIVLPPGGDKWLLIFYFFLSLNHSFKRFNQDSKAADSFSNGTSEVFMSKSFFQLKKTNISLKLIKQKMYNLNAIVSRFG